MPIGLIGAALIGTAASTGTAIYATKKASDYNNKALKAGQESDRGALALENKKYDAYVKANQPMWDRAQTSLRSLEELAGHAPQAPNAATPQQVAPMRDMTAVAAGAPVAGARRPVSNVPMPRMPLQDFAGGMTNLVQLAAMDRASRTRMGDALKPAGVYA